MCFVETILLWFNSMPIIQMKPTRTMSKSPLAVAKLAYQLAQASLDPYSSLKSRHDFTQWQLFAILVLKQFFKTDYRGIVAILADMSELRQALMLKKLPHYSTLDYAQQRLMKLEQYEQLQAAIFAHADQEGRIAAEPEGAIDSTGLESRHISQHYIHRKTALRDYTIRDWTKLTTICETQSYLWSAAIVSTGPNYDAAWYIPAVLQGHQWLHLATLLGDGAFDNEEFHRLARQELGIQRTLFPLNPRWSTYRAARTPYRREMQLAFNDHLYHHRWHVESSFSQDKRVLGSSLRSHSENTRENECRQRVLTHNLMLLALLYYVFNKARSMLNVQCSPVFAHQEL